jgi:hypothetical protein
MVLGTFPPPPPPPKKKHFLEGIFEVFFEVSCTERYFAKRFVGSLVPVPSKDYTSSAR